MAKRKNKKKSKTLHLTFNKKEFLADGTAILRVSDCNTSVRIWNDFNNKEEVKEMLLKVVNLRALLWDFEQEIKSRL